MKPIIKQSAAAFWSAALLLVAPRWVAAAEPGLDWDPARTYVFAVGLLEWQRPNLWAGFPEARKNRADVRLVRRFREMGVPDDQIVFLKDSAATKAEVQSALAELLDATADGDFLIFYFAGHGYRDPETNQTWFAPYDAGKKDSSGWNIRGIFNTIEARFSGDRALLLADCCHSGALYDEVCRRKSAIAYATLTSAYSHNTSTGAWTFTDALVNSFTGRPGADYDGDRFVELHEAARYVQGEMAFVEGQMSMFAAGDDFPRDVKLAPVRGTAKPKADSHCEAFSEGEWYKAHVVEYDAARDRYYVHYVDYDASFDEWLPAANVRAYAPRQFTVGARVSARDEAGDWYPAVVRQAWYGLHLVRYDDFDETWDEWVGPESIRGRNR